MNIFPHLYFILKRVQCDPDPYQIKVLPRLISGTNLGICLSYSFYPPLSLSLSLYLFSTCDHTVLSSVICCLTFRSEPAVRRCFFEGEDMNGYSLVMR